LYTLLDGDLCIDIVEGLGNMVYASRSVGYILNGYNIYICIYSIHYVPLFCFLYITSW